MSSAGAAQLPPLMVAVPLLAAALLAPLSKWMPRALTVGISAAATLAVLGMGLTLMLYSAAHGPVMDWMGGWVPLHTLAIGIAFEVDPMNAALASFIALLVFCAGVYTWRHFDLVGTLFHSLLLAFLAAMCGYALTGDIFNMFVWFELMTAAAIALTAHKIEEASSITGAINLAVTNTIGGFIVLLGIALIYGRTDALNLAQIGTVLHSRPPDALVIVSFVLIITGYFVKGSVAPFHFWLDDAHAVAPTPVCILFSGIMVQLALYGVARIYWASFSGALSSDLHALQPLFVGMGIGTALLGGAMAYSQRHLKRLLAFSTVSHSGMFLAAIGLFNGAGLAAAALFIFAHGLIKAMLFLCAGNFLNRFRSLDEGALCGRGKDMPITTGLYLIGGIALAGCPPFAIAGAKILYDAAFKSHALFAVAMVMAFASALDAGAVLRSGIHIAWGLGRPPDGTTPREEETEVQESRLEHTSWVMVAPAFLLLAVAVWAGMSGSLRHAVEQAAAVFVNRSYYAGAALRHLELPLPPVRGEFRTTEDVITNLSVTAFALLLAFLGLYRDRIPVLLRRTLGRVVGAPVMALRGLHTGVYTDYVAYLMFGVAAAGVWLVSAAR